MAGFLFADGGEASQFYKRVDQRDKHAKSKGTIALQAPAAPRVGRENANAPMQRVVSRQHILETLIELAYNYNPLIDQGRRR